MESMRENLARIVASGAASIAEGVMEPREVVDEILDALLRPTPEMLKPAQEKVQGMPEVDKGWLDATFEADLFKVIILAAKDGA